MPGGDLLQLLRLVAALAGVLAARREAAARLGVDGRDDLALEEDRSFLLRMSVEGTADSSALV